MLPEKPGLGFELDRDAVSELAKLPLSQGKSKRLEMGAVLARCEAHGQMLAMHA